MITSGQMEPDECIVVAHKLLNYDNAGIIGIREGWFDSETPPGEEWEDHQFPTMSQYCKEIEERDPGWKAPVIRKGTWEMADPADFSHNSERLSKAWEAYERGVRAGTIEQREHGNEVYD
jgi:hypothetical protein